MKKVVFAYHSISSKNHPSVEGSFPITLERFQEQITSMLEKGWVAGKTSEIHDKVNANTFYITGDDGTTDWLYNVLPWCEDNKIPTHTAVISGPWLTSPIYPLTHLLQIILNLRSKEDLERLASSLKKKLSIEQINYIDKMYKHETINYRRIIKGSINLIMNFEDAEKHLKPFTEKEKALLNHRFAKPEEYLNFNYAEIGSHTVSHYAVDSNIKKYISEEILRNCKDIQDAGLLCSDIFTLPMKPKHGITNEDLIPHLQAAGFKGMYTDEGIWDQKSFVIPRIDAKNVESFIKDYLS